jgi:hypothetical protein
VTALEAGRSPFDAQIGRGHAVVDQGTDGGEPDDVFGEQPVHTDVAVLAQLGGDRGPRLAPDI